jgi:hypothetical protein
MTPLHEIYTAHFTVCGKPDWCTMWDPMTEADGGKLCMSLFREWHKTRLSLEMEWMTKFPDYTPELNLYNSRESTQKKFLTYFRGHCRGTQYLPLVFPNSENAALIE